MSVNYANVERDGTTTIINLARALCKIVNAVKHIIVAKYPTSSPILVLIAAIEALCPLIAAADLQTAEFGGDNTIPLEDPDSIPGIDASRPPAVPPEIA